MTTTGFVYVVDYEHQGDSDADIYRISKIDPTAEIERVEVSREDPEADCDDCEITFTFDYAKVNDFKKEFCENFSYLTPKVQTEDNTVVFVTKTGKSYKLKQDKRWSIAKKLSEALAEGMYLYASKK